MSCRGEVNRKRKNNKGKQEIFFRSVCLYISTLCNVFNATVYLTDSLDDGRTEQAEDKAPEQKTVKRPWKMGKKTIDSEYIFGILIY